MHLAGKEISLQKNPFTIAEAGINHNGELAKALRMVEVAKQAGADCIKFQTFKAEEFIVDKALTYTYYSQGKEATESMLEMFQRYEFTKDEWWEIKKKCQTEQILFLSTPQNTTDLELLLDLEIEAIKVGSDDFTNFPLLKKYRVTGLPLILSCGMADLGEIYQALNIVGALDGYPTVLMHCTSQYPTPPESVNMMHLKTLSAAFPMVTLGFSDHTEGVLAASLAVAMGACVLEKHFTLDHQFVGPDHWFSANPSTLRDWVMSIQSSYQMLGTSIIRPTEQEEKMKVLAQRSIVTKTKIRKGEFLSVENLALKRPGNGIEALYYEQLVGKKAVRELEKNHVLDWKDFQ